MMKTKTKEGTTKTMSEPQVVSQFKPAIHVKPPLLVPEDLAVSDVGQNVELRIGNSVLTFDYESALKISQLLRLHAKRAKLRAGDTSRHWSTVGILEDLKS